MHIVLCAHALRTFLLEFPIPLFPIPLFMDPAKPPPMKPNSPPPLDWNHPKAKHASPPPQPPQGMPPMKPPPGLPPAAKHAGPKPPPVKTQIPLIKASCNTCGVPWKAPQAKPLPASAPKPPPKQPSAPKPPAKPKPASAPESVDLAAEDVFLATWANFVESVDAGYVEIDAEYVFKDDQGCAVCGQMNTPAIQFERTTDVYCYLHVHQGQALFINSKIQIMQIYNRGFVCL